MKIKYLFITMDGGSAGMNGLKKIQTG